MCWAASPLPCLRPASHSPPGTMEGRWRSCVLALLMVTGAAYVRSLDYSITTTWNGQAIDHDPVNLTLSSTDDGEYLLVDIVAPFFNDPPSPDGPPGQPFFGLWNYEVVEAFFLNDQNQYVEVEVCPWGQHIVLLLSGERVTIRHSLPLEVTTQRTADTWTGTAKIPVSYLPVKVTKFNAYAIHGSDPNRVYESLYPADENATAPDFHALQYFKPIDLSGLLPNYATAPMSQLWTDALEGLFRYKITTTWDSQPLTSTPVEFTLQGFEAGVELNVTAPFYDDPAPEGPAGEPFYGLWDYEVVEMFFLNDNDEYLEVELGPWGQHLLLLLKGARNTIKHSLALDYIINSRTSPTEDGPGEWKGSAMIPPSYFPPNVSRMNAYAIHGVNEARQYQALYPAPYNDPNYSQPDFHRLDLFQPIDFEYQVKDNSEYSQVWLDAIESSGTTPAPRFEAETEVAAVTELGPFETTPEPTTLPSTTVPATTYEETVLPRTFEVTDVPRTHEATVFDTATPEPTTIIPTTQQEPVEEPDTQPTPRFDEPPPPRTPPQPQKIDLSVLRIQRIKEQPQLQVALEPRPVPEPELLIISRNPSRLFGIQRVSQSGSQGLQQRPPIHIQRHQQEVQTQPQQQLPHRRRPQNRVRGQQNQHPFHQQGQFLHGERPQQGQVFNRGQVRFQTRRNPQGQVFQRGQGQFQTRRDPQGQAFHTEEFIGQEDPQANFHEEQFQQLEGNPGSKRSRTPDEEAQRMAEEEAIREAEETAEREAAEEAARREAAEEVARREEAARKEEAARRKAAEEAARRKAAEEAARRKAAEEAARRETARREAARRKAAEEAARREAAEEAARREAAEEAGRREAAEEAGRREAAEEAGRREAAEEAARREAAEEAARREAAEEAARREVVEEAAQREAVAEEVARREAVEEAAQREAAAEEAARREAVEEAAQREAAAEEAALREAAMVASLAEQSPPLPPSHPVCFQPGLVADKDRCWVFHECVLEGGVWEMYSWKCMRGHVFDAASTSCVRGRCRRFG